MTVGARGLGGETASCERMAERKARRTPSQQKPRATPCVVNDARLVRAGLELGLELGFGFGFGFGFG